MAFSWVKTSQHIPGFLPHCDNPRRALYSLPSHPMETLLLTDFLADRSKTLQVEPISEQSVRFTSCLTDTFRSKNGENRIHELRLEGVLSIPELVIESISATSIEQPFKTCAASVAPMERLKGVRIGPGFRSTVLELIGGVRGCSHFLSMALDLGALHTLTTYLQMEAEAPRKGEGADDGRWMAIGLRVEPRLVDACVGLTSQSPVIISAQRRLAELDSQ